MSSTERNFGDRVDIPSLHRTGNSEIRFGVGQVERMYDIPLRDIPGLKLDRDMRNAVVRVATVMWGPDDWAILNDDGTRTKGGARKTVQDIGVAFLRRVAGPDKNAQGNIEKIGAAQEDFYANRRGALRPDTQSAVDDSEEFWAKRRGPDANYVTRIPPPLFDPGPMGKLQKQIKNTVIPRDVIKTPVMTPEMEEQIRADRRARAERDREFDRQQEEAGKKLAPFLDPTSMAAMLKKKKNEPLPPTADSVPAEEEDPYEALAREMSAKSGKGIGESPEFNEADELLKEMRAYSPDEYDMMLEHLIYIRNNFRESSIVRGNIADFYDRMDQIPSAVSSPWYDYVDVATWKRLIGGFSYDELDYLISLFA
jgi:hypothetical protein